MSNEEVLDLARKHGLRVNEHGHIWGHVSALAALLRAVMGAK